MKKKIYIFFTHSIIAIAGTQAYTAGKASYLKARGWKVYVCFNGPNEGECAIPSLNEYVKVGGGWYFLQKPPYKFNRNDQENILNFMIKRLNLDDYNNCEILIESHAGSWAYWAELLAYKVKGRHFFIACDETYRDIPARFYEDNLDFFYFKWKRNELVIVNEVIDKLFNGYKNVTKTLVEIPNTVREQDAVQDVHNSMIESLPKLDWNICHIGRYEKSYVPYAISGISQLAKKYPDKSIHFIMIGKANLLLDTLKKSFNGLSNVRVTLLGDVVPLPKILFSKIDVVIAISQTARFAANEGVFTIVANAIMPDKAAGVLGYDTQDTLYGEGANPITYFEALENVLVKRLYDNRKYDMPELLPAEHYYDKFWDIVKNAAQTKEYFTKLSQERIRDWVAIFPFGIVPKNARIILYGATDIRKDYIKQIDGQHYCQVVTTIDEHSEEYDNSVDSLERLKQVDYDGIVISTFPQDAQAAYNNIMKIVPQMQGRIVYNFQVVFT